MHSLKHVLSMENIKMVVYFYWNYSQNAPDHCTLTKENLLIHLSFTNCEISTNQSDLDIKCCCQHCLAWSVDFASWALPASSFKRMHKIHFFLKWNMTEWSIVNIHIFDICNNSVNTSDRHFLILIPSIMKRIEAKNEIQSKFNHRY